MPLVTPPEDGQPSHVELFDQYRRAGGPAAIDLLSHLAEHGMDIPQGLLNLALSADMVGVAVRPPASQHTFVRNAPHHILFSDQLAFLLDTAKTRGFHIGFTVGKETTMQADRAYVENSQILHDTEFYSIPYVRQLFYERQIAMDTTERVKRDMAALRAQYEGLQAYHEESFRQQQDYIQTLQRQLDQLQIRQEERTVALEEVQLRFACVRKNVDDFYYAEDLIESQKSPRTADADRAAVQLFHEERVACQQVREDNARLQAELAQLKEKRDALQAENAWLQEERERRRDWAEAPATSGSKDKRRRR
jgi:hypothetical protein